MSLVDLYNKHDATLDPLPSVELRRGRYTLVWNVADGVSRKSLPLTDYRGRDTGRDASPPFLVIREFEREQWKLLFSIIEGKNGFIESYRQSIEAQEKEEQCWNEIVYGRGRRMPGGNGGCYA